MKAAALETVAVLVAGEARSWQNVGVHEIWNETYENRKLLERGRKNRLAKVENVDYGDRNVGFGFDWDAGV